MFKYLIIIMVLLAPTLALDKLTIADYGNQMLEKQGFFESHVITFNNSDMNVQVYAKPANMTRTYVILLVEAPILIYLDSYEKNPDIGNLKITLWDCLGKTKATLYCDKSWLKVRNTGDHHYDHNDLLELYRKVFPTYKRD